MNPEIFSNNGREYNPKKITDAARSFPYPDALEWFESLVDTATIKSIHGSLNTRPVELRLLTSERAKQLRSFLQYALRQGNNNRYHIYRPPNENVIEPEELRMVDLREAVDNQNWEKFLKLGLSGRYFFTQLRMLERGEEMTAIE